MPECPHCGGEINLITQSEAAQRIEYSPNGFTNLVEAGRFPKPWATIAARNVWLESSVDEFFSAQTDKTIERMQEMMAGMTPETRERALAKLLEETKHGEARQRTRSRR